MSAKSIGPRRPRGGASVPRLGHPQRGPLLLVSGGSDHTVPHAITKASFDKQKRNPSPTEFTEVPNRGHSLTIDSGWQEVADRVLEFVKRFSAPGAAAA